IRSRRITGRLRLREFLTACHLAAESDLRAVILAAINAIGILDDWFVEGREGASAGPADPAAVMLDGAGNDMAAGDRPTRRFRGLPPRRPQQGKQDQPGKSEKADARQEGLRREVRLQPLKYRGAVRKHDQHRKPGG